MRMKGVLLIVFSFVVIFAVAGCTHVRTYTVEKDRVDQDLSQGNAGYMSGTSGEAGSDKDRKLTRTTYVAEVELGSSHRAKRLKKQATTGVVETVQEPLEASQMKGSAETVPEASETKEVFTSYTVQNNDTLQKISSKVYGTSKKWNKIYEANKDKMKTPDRIYAGQVLKIPQV